MDDTFWIVVLAVSAALAIGLYFFGRRRRQSGVDEGSLRRQFGPEYDRAVEVWGDPDRAQRALSHRLRRVSKLRIRPLSAEAHARFERAWYDVQSRFVETPAAAVIAAQDLVEDVMRARGYPVESVEQEIADLSVHHAVVVQHYRAASTLARGASKGRASTEDLRQAMVHYRALFGDLLERDVRAHGTTEESYA